MEYVTSEKLYIIENYIQTALYSLGIINVLHNTFLKGITLLFKVYRALFSFTTRKHGLLMLKNWLFREVGIRVP